MNGWAEVTKWLVFLTAPAQTLFVILYATGSPWARSLIGRALLTKATALAILLDLTVATYLWHTVLPIWLGTVVMALIFAGSYMQLVAYLHDRWRNRHGHRGDPDRYAPPRDRT